ncbi:four-domain proteases inhibitor-like [Ceratina calcarata]|uniref:Four-domain proteases inhibitor-like n=1 Tax=Ceratina calcarata TaxID=156304 RepID=A0AAJ7JC26_9HYME|nr:four-domain proteases inhibitor-like [Ceratina calcarata]
MQFFPIALVAVALCGTVIGFPQNDDNGAQSVPTTLVDGFAFDGPADRPQTVNGGSTIQRPSTMSTSSTSTPPTTTTSTDQARYDQCITRCPVTIEYNPVCGTDNVDYSNPGGLGCAQTCGRNITLQYFGRCQTTRVRGR